MSLFIMGKDFAEHAASMKTSSEHPRGVTHKWKQLHCNLQNSSAKADSMLRSLLVRQFSNCIKFRIIISSPFRQHILLCVPLACSLTTVWNEQMTQLPRLRANGDLYLRMTCFTSLGVVCSRTCWWEERMVAKNTATKAV